MEILVLETEPHAADSTRGADAVVWRDRNRLRVRLDGPDQAGGSVRGLFAADVAAALRAFDPHTPKIDTSFV